MVRAEKEKFLITGADGFLGKRLFDLLGRDFSVVGLDISNKNNPKVQLIDITNKEKVFGFVKEEVPQVIIHAAAISSVGECEKEPEKAWRVNFEGVVNVASVSGEVGARLIYTSSLNVYGGTRGDYSEEDETKPVNVYGQTKLAAEKEVLKISPRNIVLRVGTLYGYNGTPVGMTVEAVERLQKGNEVVGLTDAIRNFTWIDDFAPVILTLLRENAGGIYNACVFEEHSDYEFLVKLAEVFGFDPSLVKAKKSPPHVAKKATMKAERIKALGVKMTLVEGGLWAVNKQMGKENE